MLTVLTCAERYAFGHKLTAQQLLESTEAPSPYAGASVQYEFEVSTDDDKYSLVVSSRISLILWIDQIMDLQDPVFDKNDVFGAMDSNKDKFVTKEEAEAWFQRTNNMVLTII